MKIWPPDKVRPTRSSRPGAPVELGERRDGGGRRDAGADGEARRDERIRDLEPAAQRQIDRHRLAEHGELQGLAVRSCSATDRRRIAAPLRSDIDQALAARAGDLGNTRAIGPVHIDDGDRAVGLAAAR